MRGHHAATEFFSCQKHFNALYLQPLDTLNSVCMCVCVCLPLTSLHTWLCLPWAELCCQLTHFQPLKAGSGLICSTVFSYTLFLLHIHITHTHSLSSGGKVEACQLRSVYLPTVLALNLPTTLLFDPAVTSLAPLPAVLSQFLYFIFCFIFEWSFFYFLCIFLFKIIFDHLT